MREPMRRSIALAMAAAAACVATALPATATAPDPYRPRQWALDRIQADSAWSASQGAGITIAVVDTGIDLTHPDLKSKIGSHYTCINSCVDGGDDDNGHGSHVAGIAAAATHNGIGISGVAPLAKLMAVKALGADGGGACNDIEMGIRWAADHGARVVNLSLGPAVFRHPLSVYCIQTLQNAAAYAWNAGAVVVIAAGNDGLVSLYTSGDLLVVGATAADDSPAGYSNSGANIYAPGGDSGGAGCQDTTCVFSTWKGGAYADDEGTSMAVPHVSGVAALLLARGYTNAQALSRIQNTADNVGGIPRLNAARAVGAPASPSAVTPGASGSGSHGGSPRSSGGTGSNPGTPGTRGTPAPGTPGATTSTSAVPSVQGTGSSTPGGPLASGPAPGSRGSSSARRIALLAIAAAVAASGGARIVMRRRRVRPGDAGAGGG